MTTTCSSRATAASRSVLGPGIGSARSKSAMSSRWQKYCARKSSGRQMTRAPARAASRTRSAALSRLASGSGPQDICTKPMRYFKAVGMLFLEPRCYLILHASERRETGAPRLWFRRASGLLEDEDCRGNHGRPSAAFVADRRLRDVGGTDNLVRDAVNLLLLVPARVRIELHVERGGQHLRRQLFCVLPGLFLGLAKAVVFAQVAISIAVGGDSNANAGSDQAMRFACGILGYDGEDHLARGEVFDTLFARDKLGVRWEDR